MCKFHVLLIFILSLIDLQNCFDSKLEYFELLNGQLISIGKNGSYNKKLKGNTISKLKVVFKEPVAIEVILIKKTFSLDQVSFHLDAKWSGSSFSTFAFTDIGDFIVVHSLDTRYPKVFQDIGFVNILNIKITTNVTIEMPTFWYSAYHIKLKALKENKQDNLFKNVKALNNQKINKKWYSDGNIIDLDNWKYEPMTLLNLQEQVKKKNGTPFAAWYKKERFTFEKLKNKIYSRFGYYQHLPYNIYRTTTNYSKSIYYNMTLDGDYIIKSIVVYIHNISDILLFSSKLIASDGQILKSDYLIKNHNNIQFNFNKEMKTRDVELKFDMINYISMDFKMAIDEIMLFKGIANVIDMNLGSNEYNVNVNITGDSEVNEIKEKILYMKLGAFFFVTLCIVIAAILYVDHNLRNTAPDEKFVNMQMAYSNMVSDTNYVPCLQRPMNNTLSRQISFSPSVKISNIR